ncbi:hypothetical protein HD554DRAFT_2038075 [Boletus coccyginus]|nr:hypothetical protein HD554DRAFT_2038075 [Boletus coccyginus]
MTTGAVVVVSGYGDRSYDYDRGYPGYDRVDATTSVVAVMTPNMPRNRTGLGINLGFYFQKSIPCSLAGDLFPTKFKLIFDGSNYVHCNQLYCGEEGMIGVSGGGGREGGAGCGGRASSIAEGEVNDRWRVAVGWVINPWTGKQDRPANKKEKNGVDRRLGTRSVDPSDPNTNLGFWASRGTCPSRRAGLVTSVQHGRATSNYVHTTRVCNTSDDVVHDVRRAQRGDGSIGFLFIRTVSIVTKPNPREIRPKKEEKKGQVIFEWEWKYEGLRSSSGAPALAGWRGRKLVTAITTWRPNASVPTGFINVRRTIVHEFQAEERKDHHKGLANGREKDHQRGQVSRGKRKGRACDVLVLLRRVVAAKKYRLQKSSSSSPPKSAKRKKDAMGERISHPLTENRWTLANLVATESGVDDTRPIGRMVQLTLARRVNDSNTIGRKAGEGDRWSPQSYKGSGAVPGRHPSLKGGEEAWHGASLEDLAHLEWNLGSISSRRDDGIQEGGLLREAANTCIVWEIDQCFNWRVDCQVKEALCGGFKAPTLSYDASSAKDATAFNFVNYPYTVKGFLRFFRLSSKSVAPWSLTILTGPSIVSAFSGLIYEFLGFYILSLRTKTGWCLITDSYLSLQNLGAIVQFVCDACDISFLSKRSHQHAGSCVFGKPRAWGRYVSDLEIYTVVCFFLDAKHDLETDSEAVTLGTDRQSRALICLALRSVARDPSEVMWRWVSSYFLLSATRVRPSVVNVHGCNSTTHARGQTLRQASIARTTMKQVHSIGISIPVLRPHVGMVRRPNVFEATGLWGNARMMGAGHLKGCRSGSIITSYIRSIKSLETKSTLSLAGHRSQVRVPVVSASWTRYFEINEQSFRSCGITAHGERTWSSTNDAGRSQALLHEWTTDTRNRICNVSVHPEPSIESAMVPGSPLLRLRTLRSRAPKRPFSRPGARLQSGEAVLVAGTGTERDRGQCANASVKMSCPDPWQYQQLGRQVPGGGKSQFQAPGPDLVGRLDLGGNKKGEIGGAPHYAQYARRHVLEAITGT